MLRDLKIGLFAPSAASQRLRHWAATLSKFTLVQLVVQALGVLAGLIVVRTLDKQQYAYYTVASGALAALFWLANSGVTFAASAIGGRVWQDERRLGQVVTTALKVSRWPTVLAMVALLPMLIWLLHENGAPAMTIVVLSCLIVGSAAVQVATAILSTAARLRSEFRLLQRMDLILAGARLILMATAALVYLNAPVALLLTAIGMLSQWVYVRSWLGGSIDLNAPIDPDMASEMARAARRQWLNEVYYAFSGQISVLLLSTFGTMESVADLGALSRLSVVFSALGATMVSVVLPVYARSQEPRRLRQLYVQILSANVAIALVPVAVVFIAPGPFLWILGSKYQHLQHDLLLVAISAGAVLVQGISGGLNQARAWIIPGWFAVPINLGIQIALIIVIGPTSLSRVIWMSIIASLSGTVMNALTAVFFGRRFARSYAEVHQASSVSSGA